MSELPPSLAADYVRWQAQKEKRAGAPLQCVEVKSASEVFAQARAELEAAFKQLPEKVHVPAEYTPQGQRALQFKRICPVEFLQPIQDAKLPSVEAFHRVANWDGSYPGPIAIGETGSAKTRAAWVALGRQYVRHSRTFSWFSTKRLTEHYFENHMDGEPERFWRRLERFHILFIDDLDKLELNDRNATMAFEFADWIYREHRAVITTTNRSRDWWIQRMGEAFVRRLFDEAHFPVAF